MFPHHKQLDAQLVADAATYTTHNKRKEADFDIAALGVERPQTDAVDRAVPSYLFAGSLNIVRRYTCVLLDVSFVQDLRLDAFLFPPTRAAHFFPRLIAQTTYNVLYKF
jgi:hypothetical protein